MHVLLVASYLYYASWSMPWLALMLATSTAAYFCATKIAHSAEPGARKRWLILGLFANLSVLSGFKLFGAYFGSTQLTIEPVVAHLSAMKCFWLPVGISFYTFEAISYLVDVYRGGKVSPNFLAYNFYIMFFPHLVAGPIVRFDKFFPQYANGIESPSWDRLKSAFLLIVTGYATKIILADGAASLLSSLSIYDGMPRIDALAVAWLFGARVYCDFLGYTQIARGIALLFNLELPINFRNPERAGSIAIFWTRWNITLSSWLHDYVFVPIGGRKSATFPRMAAAVITMLVAGIWHGTGLNFVLMGLYFGILVAGYHLFRAGIRKLPPALNRFRHESRLYAAASWMLTLYLILPAIVLFNPDLNKDLVVIKSMLPWGNVSDLTYTNISFASGVALSLFLLVTYGHREVATAYFRVTNYVPYWVKVQAVTLLILSCAIIQSQQSDASFIYAQF